MASKKKLLQAAAGAAGAEALDVDDVFSTYVYDSTHGTSPIVNGINLADEGGMVWFKHRTSTYSNILFDTERGTSNHLVSNTTAANATTIGLSSFNTDGFSFSGVNLNVNSDSHVAWTFRKAPKFFDVVTYTGTSSAQAISHNLGSVPGMIIVKCTNTAKNWGVYHSGTGSTKFLQLNTTDGANINSGFWNDTDPTSTQFTLGNQSNVNGSGNTYVAYLFAHNNSDGEFGPDSDQDIIKCGSYTGTGSSGNSITLGFEPQWVMIKRTDSDGGGHSWRIFDAMRGFVVGGTDSILKADATTNETGNNFQAAHPTSTGFKLESASAGVNGNGGTYIYMAIRRGPLAAPESATDVFSTELQNAGGAYTKTTGFITDMIIQTDRSGTAGVHRPYDRLRGGAKYLETASTAAEASGGSMEFDNNTGYTNSTSLNTVDWVWKRAPEYFDVVAYVGNRTGGASQVIPHNLTVTPEMIWVKNRTEGQPWQVYTAATGNTLRLSLDTNEAAQTDNSWGNTNPTETHFTVGNDSGTNNTNDNLIAYLFATVAGVSKVGSYTGNGSSSGPTVDCGFSGGPRFVLIKRTDDTANWFVMDSARGITAGNDPLLALNLTSAEQTADYIDPTSSGFQLVTTASALNANGGSYIFYAIA